MEKYKCNSCGNHFNGDEYTFNCPNCNDSDIIIVPTSGGNTIKNLILQNKRVLIIISTIIVITSIFVLKKQTPKGIDPNDTKIDLKIKMIKSDNFISIKITTETDKKVLDYNHNQSLFISAGFEAQQNGHKIVIKEGVIYPCNPGIIKLIWNDNFGNIKRSSRIIDFEFSQDAEPNQNANCKIPLEMTVEPLDNCQIKISSNYDTLYPGEVIMISINGKNGTYKNQKSWTLNKVKKDFDVWGFIAGDANDTIQPIRDYKGTAKGCDPFDSVDFERKAKHYGNNPKDMSSYTAFKGMLPRSAIIKHNGTTQSHIADLSTILRTSFIGDGIIFNVIIDWKFDKSGVKNGVKSINFTERP